MIALPHKKSTCLCNRQSVMEVDNSIIKRLVQFMMTGKAFLNEGAALAILKLLLTMGPNLLN